MWVFVSDYFPVDVFCSEIATRGKEDVASSLLMHFNAIWRSWQQRAPSVPVVNGLVWRRVRSSLLHRSQGRLFEEK